MTVNVPSDERIVIKTHRTTSRSAPRYHRTPRMTSGGAFHAGFFGGLGMLAARLVVSIVVMSLAVATVVAIVAAIIYTQV